MVRRKAWNGRPPRTEAEARRFLLTIAQRCVERSGHSKASLSDVAAAAGVTRQTVYRYFIDADDLFDTAAVLASGGFLERLRARVRTRDGLAARAVESLVFASREIPKNAHLSAVVNAGDAFTVSAALKLNFVQEELTNLADDAPGLCAADRDDLAELLVRLLRSFLEDSGPPRTEDALRTYLSGWLVPAIEQRLGGPTEPISGAEHAPTPSLNQSVEYSVDLDKTFAALADPTRRALLARLRHGPATISELAQPFDMSLAAVSKHLRVLEGAGLMRREVRGREHHCHLEDEPLRAVERFAGGQTT